MAQHKIVTYGLGGYDPAKPNNNIINEQTVEVPDDPADVADQDFRAAVEKATTIADLKAILLGTRGPGVEPRRPTR